MVNVKISLIIFILLFWTTFWRIIIVFKSYWNIEELVNSLAFLFVCLPCSDDSFIVYHVYRDVDLLRLFVWFRWSLSQPPQTHLLGMVTWRQTQYHKGREKISVKWEQKPRNSREENGWHSERTAIKQWWLIISSCCDVGDDVTAFAKNLSGSWWAVFNKTQ